MAAGLVAVGGACEPGGLDTRLCSANGMAEVWLMAVSSLWHASEAPALPTYIPRGG